MMWVPAKGAFRAGTVTGTEWDDVNIGDYSAAFGYRTTASGRGSFVFGDRDTNSMGITASGAGSIAGGKTIGAAIHRIEVTGSGALAFGYASGDGVIAGGMYGVIRASNFGSVAMGRTLGRSDLISSGEGSFALGYANQGNLTATGRAAFALGENVRATANNAFALGRGFENSVADSFGLGFGSNQFSLVGSTGNVGIGTTTPAERLHLSSSAWTVLRLDSSNASNGTAIDFYDESLVKSGSLAFSNNLDRMHLKTLIAEPLVLGTNNQDSLTIDVVGNVGIGTTTPLSRLSIADGGLLVTGTTGTTPISGAGTRMMWVPAKAAFRAGTVTGTEWDNASIGSYSAAFGYGTIASGDGSLASGYTVGTNRITASGYGAFAGGSTYSAAYPSSGPRSITASGIGAFAYGTVGSNNMFGGGEILASGEGSTALGYAWGASSTYGRITSSGRGSLATGLAGPEREVIASGNGAIALGAAWNANLTATGQAAIALGQDVRATANNAFALGRGFENSVADSFGLGFGSNQFSLVGSTGNVGIGTTTPSERLHVIGTIRASNLLGGTDDLSTDANGNIIRKTSDASLKTNVVTIENALDTVLALRGVQYEWLDKERFGDRLQVGFIAQEVEPILPQVVSKGGEYWSLSSSNIVAVVVEAIKEMWVTIQGNKDRIAELETRIQQLESQQNTVNTQSSNQPNSGEVIIDDPVSTDESNDSTTNETGPEGDDGSQSESTSNGTGEPTINGENDLEDETDDEEIN